MTGKFVSDHALLRWLERGMEIDLSPARKAAGPGARAGEVLAEVARLGLASVKRQRRRLNRKARVAIEMGAVAFTYHGLRFPISGGVVVTAHKPLRAHRRAGRGFSGRSPEPDWKREVLECA